MKTVLLIVLVLMLWVSVATAEIYTVSTLAGNDQSGAEDGNGTEASFRWPYGITIDDEGNFYVADTFNWLIRKITPEGVVTTVAGTKGPLGCGLSCSSLSTNDIFSFPNSITIDDSGNLYITESTKIRKIAPDGAVSTVAGSDSYGSSDGIGDEASFHMPFGITIDDSGNLYVADSYNNSIRKITLDGVVNTFAGSGKEGSSDGISTAASFNNPSGIAIDDDENLYVTDSLNHIIRKITPNGIVTTIAGSGQEGSVDGIGTEASFNFPAGVAIDNVGNLYITDSYDNKIRKVTSDGNVSTIAGNGSEESTDGQGTEASFNFPAGITIDGSGNLYVVENGGNKIRKITIHSEVTKSLTNGWNLIGNPKNKSFDTSNLSNQAVIWSYDEEWQKDPSEVGACAGFWVKAVDDSNVTFDSSGCIVDADSLNDGWNLLSTGSPLYTPKDMLGATHVWSYDENWTYDPISVEAGSGFWVKK